MKFNSEKIDLRDWIGNRLIWNPWTDEKRIKPIHIVNLIFEGDITIEVTSFKLGNTEYLFFDKLPLSLFMNNLQFYHHLAPGSYLSLEVTEHKDVVIWWQLED